VTPLLIAIFGTVASFFAWRASVHSKGTNINIQTNHGKRPGEYLEMVAENLERINDIGEQLAAHTEQDGENFREIARMILVSREEQGQ
jgi:hypothetical protein